MPPEDQLDLFENVSREKLPERIFFPWDRPLVEQAAEFLLTKAGEERPVDLGDVLVIVPTRNAGRRLREMLANLADERGGAVIPPLAAPPSILTRPEEGSALLGLAVAGELESLGAWIAVLERIDLDHYRALFPLDPPAQDFNWARGTARDFIDLRRQLGESGLNLQEVARRLPGDHEEVARWTDLARLEERWLARIAELNRCDREAARANSARRGSLPRGIREIVVLGTPDPFPLAVEALERWAREVPVTVAIYAPESFGQAFDDWGRPELEFWLNEPIEIPDFEEAVQVAANPDDLIGRVVAMVRSADAPADSLTIGAVDSSLAPLLETALQGAGIAAFDPEGGNVSREGFHHFLRLLSKLLIRPDFPGLREFLRVPEVDAWLGRQLGRWNGRQALAALDESYSDHLAADPKSIEAFLRSDGEYREEKGWPDAESYLMAAGGLAEIRGLLTELTSGALPGALPKTLRELFGRRNHGGEDGHWATKVLETSAPVLMEGLSQIGHLLAAKLRLSPGDQMALLVDHVGAAGLSEDRAPLAIELQGWLELLWEDAPHLVIAGLNDGLVPEAIVGHAYLPENLRSLQSLRLKTNDDRLVRDLYILRVLLESRQPGGRVDVIVPKTAADGDPLKPSRLLFRCRDEVLPSRVRHVFREADSPGVQVSWDPGFRLVPGVERQGAEAKPIERIAVTAFSDYLASPFHFWANRKLRMTEIDAAKAEMDALDFGNFCHDILERYGKDESARTWTDPEKIEEFLLDTADEIALARFGRKPGLAVRIQLESARRRLAAAALREAEQRQNGWEITGAEVTLNEAYPLSLGGLEISGKIDRIERKDDQIRVIDFKTSDKATGSRADHVVGNRLGNDPEWPPEYAFFEHVDFSPRSRTKEPAIKSYRFAKLQLPLYALAVAAREPEARLRCGYFHLAKALGDIGLDDWEVDAGLLDAAKACAEGVIADVVANRFSRVTVTGPWDGLEAFHLGVPERTLDFAFVGGGDQRSNGS